MIKRSLIGTRSLAAATRRQAMRLVRPCPGRGGRSPSTWLVAGFCSLALAASGCSDAGSVGRGHQAAADSAAGLLVLGKDTIRFYVDHCTATVQSVSRPILAGHRSLTGRALQVTVLSTQVGSTTWHSVGLDFGSEYWEARRGSSTGASGWRHLAADSTEPGLGPLIELRGDTVRAEGRFLPDPGSSLESIRGSVSAPCPAS
jgi:hypothetical protein